MTSLTRDLARVRAGGGRPDSFQLLTYDAEITTKTTTKKMSWTAKSAQPRSEPRSRSPEPRHSKRPPPRPIQMSPRRDSRDRIPTSQVSHRKRAYKPPRSPSPDSDAGQSDRSRTSSRTATSSAFSRGTVTPSMGFAPAPRPPSPSSSERSFVSSRRPSRPPSSVHPAESSIMSGTSSVRSAQRLLTAPPRSEASQRSRHSSVHSHASGSRREGDRV